MQPNRQEGISVAAGVEWHEMCRITEVHGDNHAELSDESKRDGSHSDPTAGRLQRIRDEARIDERIDRPGGESDSKEQRPRPNAPTILTLLQRTYHQRKNHNHIDEIREELATSYKILHDAGTD